MTTVAERSRGASPRPGGSGAPARSRPRRPAALRGRLTTWAGLVGLALLAYVPPLLTRPGRVSADTKSYLYLDPGRWLGTAASMWDPQIGLGTVTHQTVGYLFPMGPFYWVLEVGLGLPSWVAQRLWLGTLIFAAGLGARYLLRTLGLRGPGIGVAVLAYAFTPYVLEYSHRISVILGPWAALPWLIAFVARGLRRGGWKYPALFALTVQLVGAVNLTALLFAGIGPLLWLPYAVWITREVRWREAWTFLWRTGLLTIVASLWWLTGLALQSRYGLDILRFTESIETVSATSYAYEILRGLGYWFFYGRDKRGPWNPAMVDFTRLTGVVLLSYLLPVLALLSAATVRWRHRAYFALIAIVGVTVAVAASPYHDPGPVGSIFKWFSTSSTLGFALRSTNRAVPLVALAFAAFLGIGTTAVSDALARRGRRWVGVTAAVVLGALILANAPGVWHRRYYAPDLERDEEIPRYWQQALAAVDAGSHDTRVLALPGSDFASYRWGSTIDPIEPGLIDRPYVARELVPWGSEPSTNLLNALDHRLQEEILDPDAIAPIARLMGVGDVLLRLDLQTDRYLLVPANRMWRLFSPDAPEGLGEPTRYGIRIPGELDFPEIEDPARRAREGETAPPPVAIVSVQDPLPIVRAKSVADPLIVDGDGEGLVDAAAARLLDPRRLVLYSASYAKDPEALRAQLTEGATLLVTDTNRRRGTRWASLRDNSGYTEQAGEEPMRDDLLDQRLTVFPDADDDARTVTDLVGVTSVQATSYGTPFFGYTATQRPAMVLDGDVKTSWQIGAGTSKVPRERLRITLDEPVTTDHVNLVLPRTGMLGRSLRRVTLRFDGGDPVTVSLGDRARERTGQDLTFGRRTFRELEIRVDAIGANHPDSVRRSRSRRARTTGVGISEVRITDAAPGSRPARAVEVLRMPTDLLDATGARSLDHPLTILMVRDQDELRRELELPTERAFSVNGVVQLDNDAPDELIDARLGIPGVAEGGPVTAVSGPRLTNAAARASAAVDGDPSSAWTSTYFQVKGRWLRVTVPEPITLDHLDLQVVDDGKHSIPTRLEIRAEDGTTRTVELPAVPAHPADQTTVNLPVSFDPLGGRRFKVTITGITPVKVLDAVSERRLPAPVGIAELGIPGVRRAPMPEQLPATCIDDVLAVDGKPFPIRVTGTTADALDFRELALEPCDASEGLALGAGRHTITARKSHDTGLSFSRLVLSSAAGGAAVEPPIVGAAGSADAPDGTRSAAPALRVERVSPTKLRVHADRASTPFWLVLGESINDGWRATANGKDLGAPSLVDGYANGWRVEPGGEPVEITLEWVPQRAMWVALAISLAGVFACLAIVITAVLRGRRRAATATSDALPEARPETRPAVGLGADEASDEITDDRPRLSSPLRYGGKTPSGVTVAITAVAAGVAAGALVRPWCALVVAPLAALVLVRPRLRWLVSLAPAALLALIALYVLVAQIRHSYPAQFTWPSYFWRARSAAWLVLLLLGVDVAVSFVRRDRGTTAPRGDLEPDDDEREAAEPRAPIG